jgi:biotin carboxyl carrier protein
VEHPVTEMITHVNLPAAQLQVAMGIPLGRIPDVRRHYGKSRFGAEPVDFETEESVGPHGHVIAARITAENPEAGFQPTSGAIEELNFRSTPDVWGYFSHDSHGHVHEFADSQIGHVFAWGENREDARRSIVMALKELSIRGDIHTTVEYIIEMMQTEDFKENRISTAWLDARIRDDKERRRKNFGAATGSKSMAQAAQAGPPSPNAGAGATHPGLPIVASADALAGKSNLLGVTIGAVVQAQYSLSRRFAAFSAYLQRGQLAPPALLQTQQQLQLICDGVKYGVTVRQTGMRSFELSCNGDHVECSVRALSDGGHLVLLQGRSHVAYMRALGEGSGASANFDEGARLTCDGHTYEFEPEFDPTRVCATAAGKLVGFLKEDGAHVAKGEPFAEVEVMKMYMPLLAPATGVLSHIMPEGSVLAPGALVATLVLDDPSQVTEAAPYEGGLEGVGGVSSAAKAAKAAKAAQPGQSASVAAAAAAASATTTTTTAKPHFAARRALATFERLLLGYAVRDDALHAARSSLMAALADPALPLHEVEEVLFAQQAKMPAAVVEALTAVCAPAHAACAEGGKAAAADAKAAGAMLAFARDGVDNMLSILHAHSATFGGGGGGDGAAAAMSAGAASMLAATLSPALTEEQQAFQREQEKAKAAYETSVAPLVAVLQRFATPAPAAASNAAAIAMSAAVASEHAGTRGGHGSSASDTLAACPGLLAHALGAACHLLHMYLHAERRFAQGGRSREDVEVELRAGGDVGLAAIALDALASSPAALSAAAAFGQAQPLEHAFAVLRAHQQVGRLQVGVSILLADVASPLLALAATTGASSAPAATVTGGAVGVLRALASLPGKGHAAVSRPARRLLKRALMPSERAVVGAFVDVLKKAVAAGPAGSAARLGVMMGREAAPVVRLASALVARDFLRTHPPDIRAAALEGYIYKLYRSYRVEKMAMVASPGGDGGGEDGGLVCQWVFRGTSDLEQAAEDDALTVNNAAARVAAGTAGGSDDATGSEKSEAPQAAVPQNVQRHGAIGCFRDLGHMEARFDATVALLPLANAATVALAAAEAEEEKAAAGGGGGGGGGEEGISSLTVFANVLHMCIESGSILTGGEPETVARITAFLGAPERTAALRSRGVRRVTFAFAGSSEVGGQTLAAAAHVGAGAGAAASAAAAAGSSSDNPAAGGADEADEAHGDAGAAMYTFRQRLGFNEDTLVRHIEPPMSFLLELRRLINFDVRLVSGTSRAAGNNGATTQSIHVYRGIPKKRALAAAAAAANSEPIPATPRFFVRAVLRHVSSGSGGRGGGGGSRGRTGSDAGGVAASASAAAGAAGAAAQAAPPAWLAGLGGTFADALEALEAARVSEEAAELKHAGGVGAPPGGFRYSKALRNNSVFLNVLPVGEADFGAVEAAVQALIADFQVRLLVLLLTSALLVLLPIATH